MSPAARRQEIVDAARPLFAERPFAQITTADVAKAAGCSRALVHSYFGGIRDVFLAVVAQSGASLADVRRAAPPTPIKQRQAVNIPASLDVVGANRETWFAVMGHTHSSGDPQIDALAAAVTDYNVQRSLENNSDLIADTPATRAALRALLALSDEAARLWLGGQLTRSQTEAFLITTWYHVIKHAIPAMENTSKS
jgi:AcrR family transcriptional regulator